jgi:hypothetical protein
LGEKTYDLMNDQIAGSGSVRFNTVLQVNNFPPYQGYYNLAGVEGTANDVYNGVNYQIWYSPYHFLKLWLPVIIDAGGLIILDRVIANQQVQEGNAAHLGPEVLLIDDAGNTTGCLIDNTVKIAMTVGTPEMVDLDITGFKATKQVSLTDAVEISLAVVNKGEIGYWSEATVIGTQNSVEVYEETISVEDAIGKGHSTHQFPSYTPVAVGDIEWTVTVDDDNSDVDEATASTTVKP